MVLNPKPRVRRTAHNVQQSFLFSRRIHDVVTYPVLSPQGASILIYAHDDGVSLLWRGGPSLRRRPSSHTASHSNGSAKLNGAPADDSIMVLDSDDDAPPPANDTQFVDAPEFNELHKEQEFPEVVQKLDLSFGAPVNHIAVLPMTPCTSDDAPFAGADVLKDKMVFAVSCSTPEIYLVYLPLTPPSFRRMESIALDQGLASAHAALRNCGGAAIQLGGQEQQSDGLAINLSASEASSNLAGQANRRTTTARAPRLIVAAHCREAMGTLRLWEAPLSGQDSVESISPFQVEYLPSLASSISFNPTHRTQLLVTSQSSAVRIYDYCTLPSASDEQTEGSLLSQGSWLLSLYPPFVRPSCSRKPILAASWISHGRAVMALMADGQWGIWAIDAVNSPSPSLFGKQHVGIKGAALTAFTTTGYVEGTSGLRNPNSQQQSSDTGNFVPMTPHTRRDALLSSTGLERLATIRGGIIVTSLPAKGPMSGDESVVMWLGGADHVVLIPGVNAFWQTQERRGKSDGGGVNLFSGTTPTRMVRLDGLTAGLMGERCCGVGSIVRHSGSALTKDIEQGVPIDIIIRGEYRIVIVRLGEQGAGMRIGGVVGWKRKFGDNSRVLEPQSAIIAHPRPEKPGSVTFNLSVMPGGSLRAPLEVVSMEQPLPPLQEQAKPKPSKSRASGLSYLDTINQAADAEEEADDRDIEGEILDIMEIDRALESMEGERLQGRKKVFFEEGYDDDAF